MVELFWKGKRLDGVVAASCDSDPPLETIETIDDAASHAQRSLDIQASTSLSEWQNRLILGDATCVLGSLRKEFAGAVDLIYIDPPFCSGADLSVAIAVPPIDDHSRSSGSSLEMMAYEDRWGVQPDERARGVTSLDKYLQWFANTACLLRDLLSDTGLVFVHLDDNVGHEAKVVLDEAFGADRFRGEIIWRLGTGAKSRKFFSIQHNIILAYSGGDTWTFNHGDEMAREPFAEGSLGTHFKRVDENGRRYRVRTIRGKDYLYYADEGRAIGSVWTDISSMTANSPILAEGTGYPTQKPEKLLSRILGVCSRPNNLVLDCFCGSGTTPVVASKLGRRWIACDVSRFAIHTTRKRLLASIDARPFVVQASRDVRGRAGVAPGDDRGTLGARTPKRVDSDHCREAISHHRAVRIQHPPGELADEAGRSFVTSRSGLTIGQSIGTQAKSHFVIDGGRLRTRQAPNLILLQLTSTTLREPTPSRSRSSTSSVLKRGPRSP